MFVVWNQTWRKVLLIQVPHEGKGLEDLGHTMAVTPSELNKTFRETEPQGARQTLML